jgi:hypothetical protein
MRNLWDLNTWIAARDIASSPTSSPRRASSGRHHPAMFWNGAAQRGDNVWMRQKELGIWRSWSWAQTAAAVREIAGGLLALGFAPRDTASILSNTVIEWVLADLAVLSCGGVSATASIPPMPPARCTTCARTRAPASCSWKTTSSWTRRWRCAPPALAAQDRGVRHGGPARPGRARRDQPGRTASPGPRVQRGASEDEVMQRVPAGQAGRPGDPGLHLGHHRQTQGRDAFAPWPGLHRARLQHADRALGHGRVHVLPAPVPHRGALGGEYFSLYTAPNSTSSRTRKPCRRTCARFRPRSSPPCRGSGRSSIPA